MSTKKKKKGAPVLQMAEPTEDVLKAFQFKSDYLLNNPYFDFKEIGIEDFLDKMFVRPDDQKAWPFEAEQCKAYKLWRKQYEEGRQKWENAGKDISKYKPEIDYTQMPEFRSNPIIFYLSPKLKKGTDEEIKTEKGIVCEPKHVIVLKDTGDTDTLNYDFLDPIRNAYFAIIAPVTFIGKHRSLKNAKWCYGIGVDLDYVGEDEMKNTLWRMTKVKIRETGELVQILPLANIITNSGHGLHLYFLFDHPLDVHLENQRALLEKLKHGLTETCWRPGDTSFTTRPGDIQFQGIIQGYRVPGSMTKFKKPVRSFFNEDSSYFTVRELNSFIEGSYKLTDKEVEALESGIPYNPNRVTLEEAKKKWPKWYHERIELGKPHKKWFVKRTLYDYWVSLIVSKKTPITVGHRYHCLRFIAILGHKCNVPREEVENVIMSQIKRMEDLTRPEDGSNHFLESDARAALLAYDDEESMRTSWKYIKAKSGLSAFIAEEKLKHPEKTTRRNGRNRKTHLKIARTIQNTLRELKGEGKWDENSGRKKETYANSKNAWKVAAWRYEHPTSDNKSSCAKDTELTRPTVRKWWDGVDEIYRLSGGAHIHWTFGVTPEKVGGLFKQFMIPGYDMTPGESAGMEMTFKIGIDDEGWYDQETAETWDEDILRNGEE